MEKNKQKIITFLWFDNNAEEAIKFYTSVFKNSKIVNISRLPDGTTTMGTFEINGQEFYALNGGPQFKFSPAISLFVKCETQEEVDELWEKLSKGGKTNRCGWLDDKFGVTWQIIPNALGRLMGDKDPVKSKRVLDAMLKMDKIDIKTLEEAYNQ
jgi:predicted 3-demethylubiquinone-9 3-methyltransferase (glyoxalase superfamily)